MGFSKVIATSTSTSASASTECAGVNSIQVGGPGGNPGIHILTLRANGTFAGANVYAVLGTSRSASASASWTPIADSTMEAASAIGLELPNDCFVGVVLASTSAGSTAVEVWAADSRYGGK